MHKYLAAKGKHGKTVRRETGVLGHAAGKVNSCARMERMLCTSNEETHTHTHSDVQLSNGELLNLRCCMQTTALAVYMTGLWHLYVGCLCAFFAVTAY